MQTKARFMAVLLAVVLVLSACQPTPEGDIIWNKGEGVLEEKIGAGAVEKSDYEAPDRLVLEAFGWTGGTVVVDAEVVVPDTDHWPVQEITKRTVTDQWAAEVLEVLGEGHSVYENAGEISITRPQILEGIRLLQELIANVDTDWPEATQGEKAEMVRGWQEELENWQKEYQNAPETLEGKQIDPTDPAMAGWTSLRGSADTGKTIEISRYGDTLKGTEVVLYSWDNGVGRPEYFDWDGDFTSLNGVTISKEEAIQTGIDFMEKLGETGFTPAVVRAAYCSTRGTSEGGISSWPQGYYILFTRSVDGVPTTYRSSMLDGAKSIQTEVQIATAEPAMTPTPGANETPAPQFGAEPTSDPSARSYMPSVAQEYVEMLIRDSGVNYMYWREPAVAGEVLNENVELLPFDQIVERFKSQIGYAAAFMEDSAGTLEVDRMELGMMQVRKRNSEDTYLMIPVWTFYGTTAEAKAQEASFGWDFPTEATEEIVLILNAVDGTVVDLAQGY